MHKLIEQLNNKKCDLIQRSVGELATTNDRKWFQAKRFQLIDYASIRWACISTICLLYWANNTSRTRIHYFHWTFWHLTLTHHFDSVDHLVFLIDVNQITANTFFFFSMRLVNRILHSLIAYANFMWFFISFNTNFHDICSFWMV